MGTMHLMKSLALCVVLVVSSLCNPSAAREYDTVTLSVYQSDRLRGKIIVEPLGGLATWESIDTSLPREPRILIGDDQRNLTFKNFYGCSGSGKEEIVLHLDEYSSSVLAYDYFPSAILCLHFKAPKISKLVKLGTPIVSVSRALAGPRPNLPPPPDPTRPPPEQEKSFIQKYWIYVVPLLIVLMLNGGGEEAPAARR